MQTGNDWREGICSGILVGARYALRREIGHGGMGAVWEAEDRETGSSVAVKFPSSALGDAREERSFSREVAALRRVSHRHVVRILDAGRDRGRSFIVMELLPGVTLGARLRDGARLALEEARLVVTQTALGLAAAHAAGVLHRDIKPSNLFLAQTEGGTCVKLLDFGIARPAIVEGDASISALLGSPAYMSPEQARGLPLDERTDLWSLGVVAFKVLTGAEPFSEAELPSTLQRICEGRARSLLALRPELPAALAAFFKRAFSVSPAQRFRSAAELAEAFSRACEGGTESSAGRTERTATIPPVGHDARGVGASRRRKRWLYALGLAPLVSAALGVGLAISSPRPRTMAGSPARAAAKRAEAEPLRAPSNPEVEEREEPIMSSSTPSVAVKAEVAAPIRHPKRGSTPAPSEPASPSFAVDSRPLKRDIDTVAPASSAAFPSPAAGPADPLDRRF